jgi:hypothetical protein
MVANPTVEMRSVGRWSGRCRGRMAAIVRTLGDKPNRCKRGTGSDTTGPGHHHYFGNNYILSVLSSVLRVTPALVTP